MDLLSDLNESQRQAVTHVDGPLLVLAGAGSGKTRVITRRVAHIIAQGVAPWHVLAITFTNKAAGEMKQRIGALGVPRGPVVGTFHAFCVRLLREFFREANLPGEFVIYDADDQYACVKDAMGRLEIPKGNFQPGSLQSAISRAKNKLQDPATYAAKADGYFEKVAVKVYAVYEKILRQNQALDFDDLLLRTACLLRDRPEVREKLSDRYRYVLVDEYQDTNHAQYLIAHGIALAHENICVTGDPDQSIYAWRGADINNILEFEADYPNAKVVRLEENYRSYAPILSAAGGLIAHNRLRKRKELVATRAGGETVKVIRAHDEHAEARYVADQVRRLHAGGVAYREMAVFYRVNALSRVLERAFREAGIPYQIARGVEFYNRKEIKDVLAYLRLLVDGRDDLSCKRIINTPARGIGPATVERLVEYAHARGLPLLEACAQAQAAGAGKAPAAKVAAFAALVRDLAAAKRDSVRELIETVLARTGLEDALRGSEEMRQAAGNVDELVSSAAEFDEQNAPPGENPGAGLTEYLSQVSLVSDIDSVDRQAGAVTFMTLHAAKGLEFRTVFMIGCEEGLLPFVRQGREETGDLEEERRLAFVGMTRAMDRLIMTAARVRSIRGSTTRQALSPFLRQAGQDALEWVDLGEPEGPGRRRRADEDEFDGRSRDGFHGPADERAEIEAMEQAGLLPEEYAGLRPGKRVRHPMFGPGWIMSVVGAGADAKAVIDFDRSGRKTIVLKFARLTPL